MNLGAAKNAMDLGAAKSAKKTKDLGAAKSAKTAKVFGPSIIGLV